MWFEKPIFNLVKVIKETMKVVGWLCTEDRM